MLYEISISLFVLFLLLVAYTCYSVVKKAGALTAYIGLSWMPLVLGVIWMNFEFFLSPLNPVLPILIIVVSLLLSLAGLPFILITYWRTLPASKIIGALAAAFLYGIPAFLFLILSVTGTM